MIRVALRLGLRHAARHRLRTAFTIAGVALGVAAIIGVRLVNDSAARSFETAAHRLTGKAVLQISNGEAGVPEKILDEVQRIPGVSVASPSAEGAVALAGIKGARLYIFGVDLVGGDPLREYDFADTRVSVKDKLAFLAQPDSIALTERFLQAHHLSVGETIRVASPRGAQTLTIRGALMVHGGPATLFDGRLGVMDVFAAQRLLGLAGRFSRIDVGAAKGVKLTSLEAAIEHVVGGRALVERPERSSRTLDRMLAGNRVAYSIGAALALIVGLYLVFNTMLIAVAQRRRELAILRAAGMLRREVIRLVVGEALALGAVGCAIGVPLGILFARATVAAVAADVSRRLIAIEAGQIVVSPGTLVLGAGLGLLAALVAALVPARQAVGVQPVEALERIDETRARPPKGRMLTVGVSLLGLALALFAYESLYAVPRKSGGGVFSYSVDLLLLAGVSFVAPALVYGAACVGERVLRDSPRTLAVLAVRRLRIEFRRFSVVTVALAVSLAGALSIAALTSSMHRTVVRWLDDDFGGMDLIVSTSPVASTTNATALPELLARKVANLSDVEAVDASRWVRVPYRGQLIEVVARAPSAYRTGFRAPDLTEGEETHALAAFDAENGVLISETFARRFAMHVGDFVHLRSPSGEVDLKVVGVTFDLHELGQVIIPRALYRRLWKDSAFTFLAVRLKHRVRSSTGLIADPRKVSEVAEQIRERWGDRFGLFVTTPREFRNWIEGVAGKAIAAAYPIILIAVGIAVLGLINSLFASVLARIREIGTLRALGATRRQVGRLVMAEAAFVGVAGWLAGVALGSFEGYRFVVDIIRNVVGVSIFFEYPVWAVIFSLAATVLCAAAGGYFPGRSAGKMEITEALDHE